MKTEDVVYLVLALAIFAGAGYLIATQLAPQQSGGQSKAPEVEVVGAISADFDSDGLKQLKNTDRNRDFATNLQLKDLGNTAPFGP